MTRFRVVLVLWLMLLSIRSVAEDVSFNTEERAAIRSLTMHIKPGTVRDPTNKYSGDAKAIHFGRLLFNDPALSRNGKISCASCHSSIHGWADGRPLAIGMRLGVRNTLSLQNAAYRRWFMWDGQVDTLWGQVVKPIENPFEMGENRHQVLCHIWNHRYLAAHYIEIFGKPGRNVVGTACTRKNGTRNSSIEISRHFSNVGKSLAAYVETIESGETAFDRFAQSLESGEQAKLSGISVSAKRGIKIFTGKGNCISCHHSYMFSDNEFHNIRLPLGPGKFDKDMGRYAGVRSAQNDEFSAGGMYSDNRSTYKTTLTKSLILNNQLIGQFRTPSLRNVANTAPYMHNGSIATLREVIEFYSTLKGAQIDNHHYESILKPLNLTENEIEDLDAFLHSLSNDAAE